MIAGMVPVKHRKLIVHIRKTTDRQRRKKLSRNEEEDVVVSVYVYKMVSMIHCDGASTFL